MLMMQHLLSLPEDVVQALQPNLIIKVMKIKTTTSKTNSDDNDSDNDHYTFQHILLDVCGTCPISPDRLVLSVAICIKAKPDF